MSYSLNNGDLVWTDTSWWLPRSTAVRPRPQDWQSLARDCAHDPSQLGGTDMPVTFHDRGSLSPVIPTSACLRFPPSSQGDHDKQFWKFRPRYRGNVVTQQRPRVHGGHSRPQSIPCDLEPALRPKWFTASALGNHRPPRHHHRDGSQPERSPRRRLQRPSSSDTLPRRSSMHTALIRSHSPAPAAH